MPEQFSSANNDIKVTAPDSRGAQAKSFLASMPKNVGRRWMIAGGGTVVILVMIASWVSSTSQGTPRTKVKPASVVETTPKGLTNQKDWKAQTGAEINDLKQQLNRSNRMQEELLSRLEVMNKEMKQDRETGSKKPTTPASATPNASARIDLSLPPPPEAPRAPSSTSAGSFAPSAGSPQAQATPAPAAPQEIKRAPARAFIPEAALAAVSGSAESTMPVDMVANDKKGFLPAGSFADATLISGVEAFTGGTAQSQPQPLVIRLDANAVLPNAAGYQIKGCHVLASVWGDLSSERVFGRTATLTCVDVNNKLVLSEEVEGTLVDSDGKNGIRGTIQDRQGAKLSRALLAGFAQGISEAFGKAQGSVSSNIWGTTTQTLNGSNAIKAGGYAGAEKAAEQLSDFYLKQAEATMPVIAVDAGRKISVLFTKSKSLRFESTEAFRPAPKQKLTVERSQ